MDGSWQSNLEPEHQRKKRMNEGDSSRGCQGPPSNTHSLMILSSAFFNLKNGTNHNMGTKECLALGLSWAPCLLGLAPKEALCIHPESCLGL